MAADDELKEEVGDLISGPSTRPAGLRGTGLHGPITPDQKIAALQRDVQALYRGLMLAGKQIEDLRARLGAEGE